MLKLISSTFAAVILLGSLVTATAADTSALDKLQGKWTVKKTSENGQSYTQNLEITKDKLKFKMVGSDDTVRLMGSADLKTEKLGPFNVLKLTNLKAGRSEAEIQSVDDDLTNIYQLDYDTLTMASNFDKTRDNRAPTIDVYRKVR